MSEFTERYKSWDEVVFPIEGSFKTQADSKDYLTVLFDSKDGSALSGVVTNGNDNYPKGFTSRTWNNAISCWKFKQQTYKYDPDQTGDTEEDI